MDDQFKKWEDLQKKIIEEIQKIKNDPTKTRQLSKLKKELANLKKESSNWLANEIKKEFKLGASSVDEYINTLTGETPKPNKLNLEGVGDLITEARGNFTNATNFVNRSLNSLVKEAQKERDQLNVIQDVNRSTLETILKGKLADEGVTAIETSNGRKLQLDSYVKMATQSTLKIARNKGVINQCKSRDIDLVKMTVHFPTCSICLPLQGRVYSISGTSDTYPPLSKAFGEWETVHPNCKHSIMPYIPDYVDQDQLEEDIKNSNRSYTVLNPKEQEALDRYNQEQKRKSLLRTAKKEYNNMSIVLGKDQMPSFPGFLKSKRSSGNVYKGLKDKYNAKRDLFPLEPLDQEEQYAINKFIGSSGFKLNDVIRRDQLTANDKEFITNLDKGLDKMPNYQGEVIRTITNDRGDIQDILKDLDQEVPFKSYTSASIKERFHEDASIIMRINSKTGKNISLFNKGEQEVLFKRGLKYKVISKTKKENTYYFQLEEK